MSKTSYVYIIANGINGTLYVGVTSDLIKRIWQHKNKLVKGFSEQYNLTQLVYYEIADDITSAITREKQLKAGNRNSKLALINNSNKDWLDLYPTLL